MRYGVGEEDVAFHYIMFAGDSYPTRHESHVARDLAVRILSTTGKDPFERLISLSNTDCGETRKGLMHAFASLREERAVPFLISCLKDNRKMQRVATIRALGRIGTPEGLAAQRALIAQRQTRRLTQHLTEQTDGAMDGRPTTSARIGVDPIQSRSGQAYSTYTP